MAETLITRSYETLSWMRGKGVRFQPIWGRQAFKVDGRFKFWGGLTVEAWGGGPGLVEALWQAAARNGIEIRFSSRVLDLLYDDVAVTGVRVKGPNGVESIKAKAVVLAAGGFQANPEWRTRYTGEIGRGPGRARVGQE